MADLPRVGKPAQDWTQQDLLAYNIHVHSQSQSIFFNGLSCSGGVLPSLPSTSPLYPFLTTPARTPIKNPTYLSSILLSFWNRSGGSDIELDGLVYNFVRFILENMDAPYVTSSIGIYPSPTLTLNVCGTKHEYYADLCLHPNYIVSQIISLLVTFEFFVSLNYPRWEKYESKFDLEQMRKMPLDMWRRDDVEAKLIANAIAAYDFNNYEAPKLYHDLDEENKEYVDPYFMVRDPISLAGMTWKGTCPSFYKISIGSDLVKAVQAGKYPRAPTRIYRYTPVLPEEPDGGMDKFGIKAMQPLANRRVVIGCLEAFKMFLRVKRFGTPGFGPRY